MNASRPIREPVRNGARSSSWARLGLIALSFSALMGQGCSSLGLGGRSGDGCGTAKCGKLFGGCGLSHKLFARRGTAVSADSCDGTLGAMPVEAGVPVMTPGAVLTAPAPAAGPAETDPVFEPLPKNSTTPGSSPSGSGSQGSNKGAVKSLYQTRNDRSRGEALEARRVPSSIASTPREASSGHPEEAASMDPLSDLPGLSAPADSLSPGSSPPSPPSAGDRPSSAPAPIPDLSSRTPVGMAPGIQRFHVIEPRLAAGSLPSDAGWKWLVEKGYKTVLDLRETAEVRQEELASIDHHGLRRVSLPMSSKEIDSAKIKRYEEELSREDSRPVFVFDADGTRPAALSYLHLVLARKVDRRAAEREVEELGANESPLWKSAIAYLATQPLPTAEGPAPGADSGTVTTARIDAIDAPSPEVTGEADSSRSSWVEPINALGRSAMSLGERALANLSAAASLSRSAPAGSGD